ncbi:hypothetical protein TRIUR3_11172 [Triticum urartu]|uniref:Uncharacterized protein n=1 Tax=Triticum urartu TaxID=4572 RepID=M8A7L5_TRIUA|nr:hypothetical protein TRIUR3_11172 [Triticum urartu]
MASSGGRTGSGEDVERGDSNKSGESSSGTSASSATSDGSGNKKKKKTLPLGKFHIEVESAHPQGRSAVAQTRARTADPTPQTRRPNYKSKEEFQDEFPLLGASPASSSRKQNAHAAAHPPESDRLLPREQVTEGVAQLQPGDQLMEEAAHLLPQEQQMARLKAVAAELDRLKATAAELDRLKARDDLMEELAAEGSAGLKAETNVLLKEFAHLLQTYKMKGRISFYGCRALPMVPSNDFDFVVDFNHVLDEGYIDLAVKIVKEKNARRGTGWLLKTTLDFLKTQRLLDRDNLLGVILEFDNLPETMKPFSEYDSADLMQRDMSPLGVEHNLVMAIFIGRQIYIRGQEHMLDQHDAGKTWGGHFEQKDIYVIQYSRANISCRIRPSDKNLPCSAENRVLDIQKLHQSMVSKYQIDGHYPAHFNCLKLDMVNLNATSIDASVVVQYLPYHVALMPQGAIKFMTEALYDATEGVRMNDEDFKIYKAVFEAPPSGEEDWRMEYSNSPDPLVRGVYHHDNETVEEVLKNNTDLENTRSAAVQGNRRSATVQANMRSAVVQGSMSSVGGTSTGSVRSKFQRTRKGKLNFKRHLGVHLHSHMAEKRPLKGLFQGEVYSSTKNNILGDIFSELFKGPTMKLETQ